MAPVQLITEELLQTVIERAKQSPRRRINHNFHSGADDNPHRFLNVFLKGSYVQPHRHLHPPKAESFLVLRGQMGAFLFDDAGKVIGRHLLGPGFNWGIDIAPGVWHTGGGVDAGGSLLRGEAGAVGPEYGQRDGAVGSGGGNAGSGGVSGPPGYRVAGK